LPGIKYKLIRGVFDFTGLEKRKQARSKYGTKKKKNLKMAQLDKELFIEYIYYIFIVLLHFYSTFFINKTVI